MENEKKKLRDKKIKKVNVFIILFQNETKMAVFKIEKNVGDWFFFVVVVVGIEQNSTSVVVWK